METILVSIIFGWNGETESGRWKTQIQWLFTSLEMIRGICWLKLSSISFYVTKLICLHCHYPWTQMRQQLQWRLSLHLLGLAGSIKKDTDTDSLLPGIYNVNLSKLLLGLLILFKLAPVHRRGSPWPFHSSIMTFRNSNETGNIKTKLKISYGKVCLRYEST